MNSWTTTINSSNLAMTITFGIPPPDLGDLGGVREPRDPGPKSPPGALVARKQPDGSWPVPAAIEA